MGLKTGNCADVRHGVQLGSRFVAGLLGCTMLAGLPAVALAQADAAPSSTQAEEPQGDVIRTIAVSGAQRLEPETIVSYVQLRTGQVYTPEIGDQALVDLAATELFADFSIANNDGNIVITVEENPVINRIVLEGNKRLKEDKILPEIRLSPRQIFTRSKVRADVSRIIELYKRQGRFAAVVEPQMVMLDQNRVDVIFEITEGPKSKVRQINVIGNEVFSDGKLRSEMVTKESGLLKIFSSNTSYDPDRLAFDQQKLRQFYLTEGYADFRVISAVAELTPDKRDFIITYVVEEGERYRFGDVEVESQLRDFSSEALTERLNIEEGDWYNADFIDETIDGLTETAGAFGYAFADVRPRIRANPDDLTMDITFLVADAPRVYIDSIEINGNTITQDKVIRREFRIAEGDAFSSLQVNRSNARINSLGYFQENFEISQVEGSDGDRITLQANVQEEPTGELSLSAGFSSLESFIFNGSIRQNNFRGRGQTVGLGVNYSRFSRSGNLSFTEPHLFDKDIAAGIDIYRQDFNNGFFNRDQATFEQATTGFRLRAGIPLTEYLSLLGSYTLNYDQVTVANSSGFFADLDGDGIETCEPLFAGRFLCDTLGNRTQSILGLSVTYNSLNSRLRPTSGRLVTFSADLAGLGGNTQYLRGSMRASQYHALGSGFVGSLSFEGGFIQGLKDRGAGRADVLLTDRFFLGEGQMRGFDIRGVGPRVVRQRILGLDEDGAEILSDPDNRQASRIDALGGNAYYLGRAEIEIPLGAGARELGLRPSIFVDIGATFGIKRPQLNQSPFPNGIFLPQRDENGLEQFAQINDAVLVEDPNMPGTFNCSGTVATVTNPVNPMPGCLENANNAPIGQTIDPFRETFFGDTAKPRLSFGIGVNWNSPFGPFRIDLAHVLLKQPGDETKTLSFNVGTQF